MLQATRRTPTLTLTMSPHDLTLTLSTPTLTLPLPTHDLTLTLTTHSRTHSRSSSPSLSYWLPAGPFFCISRSGLHTPQSKAVPARFEFVCDIGHNWDMAYLVVERC